ncbi:MAG: glycosyltransferase family 4 protein [Verrucomicrobia bacterium]|nr:glycosyltransferase family 4 protein [Verrucomicrobiota bacterium]
MKILFLSSYAHLVLEKNTTRVSGGAELQVALLARELALRGVEVVIVGGDTGQKDGSAIDGVRIRTGGQFHSGNPAEMLGAVPRVFSVIREERPDWVFLLGWTAWMAVVVAMRGVLGYRAGFICGLDSELTGDFRRENPLRGGLFEWGVAKCDLRYAMTDGQQELFKKRGWGCAMYRNLILPRAFENAGEKTVDFLWVSRCQPVKRPHLFLDLVEALPEHSCEMVCPREDVGLWESVAARAGKLKNLRFIEKVPYHEIQSHYDAARVFVNTSEWEGWPNSFIQAGLGRAALLSLAVNPDGIFERFGLGWFAGGDMEKLKSQAQAMLGDAAGLERMQEGCARFVAEMHDNAKETEAFLAGLRDF